MTTFITRVSLKSIEVDEVCTLTFTAYGSSRPS